MLKNYILITGASSGIGRYLSIALSNKYNIILSGRNTERLNKVKDECNRENEQVILNLDLEHLTDLESKLSDFLISNKIQVCYLVHCAAFMKMLPLKSLTVSVIEKMFSINVISVSLLIKVLINRKSNGDALTNIVFISSNISNFGAKAFSIYGASKAGLDGLMRSLAVELAPKIRVNSILPGAIQTEMTKDIFADAIVMERMEKEYPLGLGTPEDIYSTVAFLVSNESKWITGQQIVVDGGRTINISG